MYYREIIWVNPLSSVVGLNKIIIFAFLLKQNPLLMLDHLNYTSSGEGVSFVFQHGLGSNLQQPQSLLSGLKQVRLISMDCPGHGQSLLGAGKKPAFAFYADEVVNMVGSLNTGPALFGGISMGAGIALNIALRYPELVKGLVLVRPAWLDKGEPENLSILLEAARYIGNTEGRRKFTEKKEFLEIKKILPLAAQSILGVFAGTQQAEIPLVLSELVKDKPLANLDELTKLNVPCLIIGNEDDPLHPFSMAQVFHHKIQGSQLEKVVSRYIDNRSHRKQVRDLVSSFIEKL